MSESRTIAIVSFLTAGALILALGFFVDRRKNSAAADNVPALRLLSPADGDTVTNPVVLAFATPAPLRLDRTTGWSARELHLHAFADSTEIMPAATDISIQHDSTYQWRLPPLPPGPHRVFLSWAARHHGNLAGPTDTIRIYVRD